MSKLNISIGTALMLKDIANKLLYKTEMKDEKLVQVERELPFRLKYRLGRNMAGIDRDVKFFETQRALLLSELGTASNGYYEITDEESFQKFQIAIQQILSYKTPHSIMRIDPIDIDLITDSINISYEEIKVFMGYMCDEPEVFETISVETNFTNKKEQEPKKTKRKTNKKNEEEISGKE